VIATPDADDIRVTFTHFSELNLIVLRRVFLALVDAGIERRAARQLLESAAQRSWRRAATSSMSL
jgi:hypothetical protein